MTKLEIKHRLMGLLEESWSAVWPSARQREELAEYLSTRFRLASKGSWAIRADQEMSVDAAEPSMRRVYVVHRGDHEPYSSPSETEATTVAEVLSVLETELRTKKNP